MYSSATFDLAPSKVRAFVLVALLWATLLVRETEMARARPWRMREQCKKIMGGYHYDIQKGVLEPSYTHLRSEAELRIERMWRRERIKNDCSSPQAKRWQ